LAHADENELTAGETADAHVELLLMMRLQLEMLMPPIGMLLAATGK